MDKHGHIYAFSDEEREQMEKAWNEMVDQVEQEKITELREDVARLDGYLKARAEADASKRGKGANKDLVG